MDIGRPSWIIAKTKQKPSPSRVVTRHKAQASDTSHAGRARSGIAGAVIDRAFARQLARKPSIRRALVRAHCTRCDGDAWQRLGLSRLSRARDQR
ncbi:hypothetical protein GUJ93_ZPchr0001g31548 [Zizania palustris]|uniref:Uncharacterized protein n=1 Tax=Zizania palustris TaxID=103762 RepID=A0A8J5RQE8_ZIZPA|nr:hypothetical protein GUJ93_ZPchr0001g31548 [Zizania palustris]